MGVFIIVLAWTLGLFYPPAAGAEALCPTVVLDRAVDLGLSAVEKRLLCGDDQSQAWAKIPPGQARFQMKAILQTRGYLNPVMDLRDGVLHVDVGPPTLVKGLVVTGAPPVLHLEHKRDTMNLPLTPDRLSDLEGWIDRQLRFNGYPCPEVTTKADASTGQVAVEVKPGPKQKVVRIRVNDDLGLQEGVLRRYDAFQVGAFFNARDLELTERRMLADDVVASTHFTGTCGPDGALVDQIVTGGPPRTLRVGAGANTEEIVIGRLIFRHSRLDNKASQFELNALAGLRTQTVSSDLKWFYSGDTREYLMPTVAFNHQLQAYFETHSTDAGVTVGKTWDETENSWLGTLGPLWHLEHTVSGYGPESSLSLLLQGSLGITSHNFEYYRNDPRSGFLMNMTAAFSHKDLTSTVTAHKLGFDFEALWDLKEYDPPMVIYSLKGGLATTITEVDLTDNALPQFFRLYLGGSHDLRGFSLLELPHSGTGALTTAYLSFETRFRAIFPFKLDPYFFIDGGELGTRPLSLTWPVFFSPGAGLRWSSPIGVTRVNVAHGIAWSPVDNLDPTWSHWQFYLSFGEEF